VALTTDILRTWADPRREVRRLLADGPREDRAVVWLLLACVLIFVAQMPRLRREATLAPDGPSFEALMAGAFFGWVLAAPVLLYAVAAASHVVARVLGGRGGWFGARVALFWSLLAISPALLANGLVAGLAGPGLLLTLTGAAVGLAFLALWGLSLLEAEWPRPA
jgi:hypothetical protein